MRKRTKIKKSFLPLSAKNYLHQRTIDIGGLLLMGVGAGILFMLATYHAADPSLNTVTNNIPKNIFGTAGSYTADFLLQTMGLSAIVMGSILLNLGWRIFRRQQTHTFGVQILYSMAAILCLAASLNIFTPPPTWPLKSPLGGFAGAFMMASLLSILPGMAQVGWMVTILMAVAGMGFTGLAMGLTVADIMRFIITLAHNTIRTTKNMVQWSIVIAARLIGKPLQEKAAEKISQKVKSARKKKRKPELSIARETKIEPRLDDKKPGSPAQASFSISKNNKFELPSLDLLKDRNIKSQKLSNESLEKNARLLEAVLSDFGIKGEIVKVRPGPVVTLYELEPVPGTKTARVVALADDIARSMSAVSVRVAVIPGRNVIGIELPNAKRENVYLKELLSSDEYDQTRSQLPLILGKDIGGAPIIVDLSKMPHLLIAGTTGSGKSVGVNTMILSLLYNLSPDQCRLIMIDPKMLELSSYDDIPHLLTPVVTDPKKAVVALKWAVREMEDRYRAMSKVGVRNIESYNQRLNEARQNGETITRRVQTGFDKETGSPIFEQQDLKLDPMPYIVVVVDEMADLMLIAGKDIESAIQRLAQMARAAGIHLIMATQRPSVDVITGTIKANFPTRISFQVTSKIDSRTILGEGGAEQLLGKGDMLYMAGGGRINRVHGAFVEDEEVEQVAKFLKTQGHPEYLESVTIDEDDDSAPIFDADGEGMDPLFNDVVNMVLEKKRISTSFIQRQFQIGYNRAARIVDQMESAGIISPANHTGKREILIDEWDQRFGT